MQFEAHLRSPKSNPLVFYGLYFLFLLNDGMIKSPALRQTLWMWIKCELFYIAGACKHSGNCCRHIVLVHEGKPMNDRADFERRMKDKQGYTQFSPHYEGDRIACFSCQWLTPHNKCAHYDRRPLFCRQYPMSTFVQHSRIYDGCGFYIAPKTFQPKIRYSGLKSLIKTVQCEPKNGTEP